MAHLGACGGATPSWVVDRAFAARGVAVYDCDDEVALEVLHGKKRPRDRLSTRHGRETVEGDKPRSVSIVFLHWGSVVSACKAIKDRNARHLLAHDSGLGGGGVELSLEGKVETKSSRRRDI